MTSVHTQTQTKISRSINKTLWVTTAFKHRGYSVKKKSEREREKKGKDLCLQRPEVWKRWERKGLYSENCKNSLKDGNL